MTKGPMIPISQRNRQMLQLRKEGMSRTELARRFIVAKQTVKPTATFRGAWWYLV
jgi:DNA-binding CsgD family transcriptional regulator